MNFPALHGNWVDLLILIILLFYVLNRGRKGFIYEFLDVIGFLFSLLIALKFYYFAARFLVANFTLPKGIANAIGFMITAVISEFVFYACIVFIDKYIDKRLIASKWNIRLGFIPAVFSALILISFVLTTMLTLPIRPRVKQDIIESKLGGFLAKQTFGVERYVSEIFGGAVQDTLNFLTVKPQSNEVVDLNFKTNDVSIDTESEDKMFMLVNKERASREIKTLTADLKLQMVARNHCKDMFARGYFSHYTPEKLSPFDRIQNAGITYQAAGENLAYAPTIDIAHTGLMESPGHRANILSKEFGKVGIGVISAGIYGKMFCQEFID